MREVTDADETMENKNNNNAASAIVDDDGGGSNDPVSVEDNRVNEMETPEDLATSNDITEAISEAVSDAVLNEVASSTTSSGVTLETLSEDGVLTSMTHPGASSANGGQPHTIHHPLLTPTSPRSVTTASMSASGRLQFCYIYRVASKVERWGSYELMDQT